MRLTKEWPYSQRGESRSQTTENRLCTYRLIPALLSKNVNEIERLEFHLELRDAGIPEIGDCWVKEPAPGSTRFEHVGFLVLNVHGVWSYCHLEAPDEPRGAGRTIASAAHGLINAVDTGHESPPLAETYKREESRYDGHVQVQTHESFGLASLSHRGSSGDGSFFGSKVRHDNSVTLTVKRAEMHRDLSHEWYFGGIS